MAELRQPARAGFLRRKQVCDELGIGRHTLARIIVSDPSFPKFFGLSPGVEVLDRADLDAWIRGKKLASRVLRLNAPTKDNKGRANGLRMPVSGLDDGGTSTAPEGIHHEQARPTAHRTRRSSR